MALTETLNKNVIGFGTLAIAIVIMSVVLLKFKDGVGSSLCTASNGVLANQTTYNTTIDACCFTNASLTGACTMSNSTPTMVTDIGTYVSALSEPKNWVAIVIIALIGFGVLKLFMYSRKK